jgi:Fe-S-cluster-containing dehydrogenase component
MTTYFRELGNESTDRERIRNLENTIHGMTRCTESIDKGQQQLEKKLVEFCHENELALSEMKNTQLQSELKKEAIGRRYLISIVVSMLAIFGMFGWWMFEKIISQLGS